MSPNFDFFHNIAVTGLSVKDASACFAKVLDAHHYSLPKDPEFIHKIVHNCVNSSYPMCFTAVAKHISSVNAPLKDFLKPDSIMDALKMVLDPQTTVLSEEERLFLWLSALLTTNQAAIKHELFRTETKLYL